MMTLAWKLFFNNTAEPQTPNAQLGEIRESFFKRRFFRPTLTRPVEVGAFDERVLAPGGPVQFASRWLDSQAFRILEVPPEEDTPKRQRDDYSEVGTFGIFLFFQ